MGETLSPQNLRAEVSVIGACLQSTGAMTACVDLLESPHFYRVANSMVWRAMVALHYRQEPVDTVTCAAELERAGWTAQSGGYEYLCECVDQTPSAANATHYARLVRGAWVRREVLGLSERLKAAAYDPETDIEDAIADVTGDALALQMDGEDEDAIRHHEAIIHEFRAQIEQGPTRTMNRVSTGVDSLDVMIGGYQRSDLIYLGGGPGSGKTTLAMQSAWRMACRGEMVVMVSMELGSKQYARRLAGFGSMVEGKVMEYGPRSLLEARMQHIVPALVKIAGLPMHVSFKRMSTTQIASRVKHLIARTGKRPAAVFIDRLELLADRDCASMEETKRIPILSPRVKGIATSLDVPVVCLVQLNRQGRHDEPTMESFRASGSIEQDCQVGIIVRSDKDAGTARFHVVKHNDGETGACPEVVWAPKYPMFLEMERRTEF